MDSKPAPDPDVELGRRLLAALLSYHLRVGLDYTLKKYVPQDIDPAWTELGRALLRGMQDQVVSRILGADKPQ